MLGGRNGRTASGKHHRVGIDEDQGSKIRERNGGRGLLIQQPEIKH